ncbi:unnamed protein product [Amoebophrya sp. A25]|nr:unnamed protein product [Amoebophrya sp. A25]|eukprot:GSA25T00019819001.1
MGKSRKRLRDVDVAEQEGARPRKADYRQRAHCNPLSDFLLPAPISPAHIDWSLHYPDLSLRAGPLGVELEPSKEQDKKTLSGEAQEAASSEDAVKKQRKVDEDHEKISSSDLVVPGVEELLLEEQEGASAVDDNKAFSSTKRLFLNTSSFPLSYPEVALAAPTMKPTFGVDFIDVGCGFGGLTVALAEEFPEKNVLGLEIREQVTNYVGLRILAKRDAWKKDKVKKISSTSRVTEVEDEASGAGVVGVGVTTTFTSSCSKGGAAEVEAQKEQESGVEAGSSTLEQQARRPVIASSTSTIPLRILDNKQEQQLHQDQEKVDELHHFFNAAVMRTNAMKTFPNYFRKGELSKLFFCFPDPHFKKKTHRRRIVNDSLLSVYSYCLRPNGRIYCITDVKDLYEWMYDCLARHPGFQEIFTHDTIPREKAEKEDVCVKLIHEATEEGHKVKNLGRFGKIMYYCVFEKK